MLYVERRCLRLALGLGLALPCLAVPVSGCLGCTSPAVCNTVLSCLAGLIRVGLQAEVGVLETGPVVWAIAGVFSSFATGLGTGAAGGCWGLLGLNRGR